MTETRTIRFLRGVLGRFFRFFCRLEFYGQQYIPDRGPCIVAPNHQTYFDPMIVGLGIKQPARYMAWDQLFRVPLMGALMLRLGAFPVNVRHPDKASYKRSLDVLRGGDFLVVFPEGARSRDGKLMPLKPGVARMALATGATLLPCTIRGGERVWPPRRFFPRPGPMSVTYHRPIPVAAEEFSAPDEERIRVNDILAQLRSALAEETS